MKKLNYLLLLTILILNISCSKDDVSVDNDPKERVFKITLELSGDYEKYSLNFIITNGPVFENDRPRKAIVINTATGEEVGSSVAYHLNESFSEFKAVDKTSYIVCALGGGYIHNETAENAIITYKLYADGKLTYEKDIVIFPKAVNKVTILKYSIQEGMQIMVN